MTFIRKKTEFTYYTGNFSGIGTAAWSKDYNDRKVYASKEDAETVLSSSNYSGNDPIVGIVTDVYVPF